MIDHIYRSKNKQEELYGNIQGVANMIGAVNPILDTLKPTRKELIIENLYKDGNKGRWCNNRIYLNLEEGEIKSKIHKIICKRKIIILNQLLLFQIIIIILCLMNN